MRRSIIAAIVLMLTALPWGMGPAKAEDQGAAITAVIESQLQAFQRNDLDVAYSFASPTIQRMFGNPQRFGKMVQNGYPMVWRPSSYRMDRLLETEAGLVQIVMFEDASGRFHEAGYLMELIDGRWRIAGVHVRRQPGVGT